MVAPSAPTGLTATAVATNRIELAWADNATNEMGYLVEHSLDSNAWVLVTLTAANATNTSDSGLASNTLYYYRVAATNAAGRSAYCFASATTLTAYEQWRRAHFTTAELADPEKSGDDADPDHDTMSNLKEFYAGTIPTNRLSVLCIEDSEFRTPSSEFVIRWQSATGRVYTVLAATNLITGFDLILGTNIQATPMENVYTDNVGTAGMRFYRVELE